MATTVPEVLQPNVESSQNLPAPAEESDDRSRGADRFPRPKSNPRTESSELYRRIWRWHFYAGIFAAPVLFVAAVTGLLYVFRAELEPILYRSKMVVDPIGNQQSYQSQLDAARAEVSAEGDLAFVLIPSVVPGGTNRATMFAFDVGDHVDQQVVYVNPYDAEVTGSHYHSTEFFNIVLTIHRTLFAGTFGRLLMELATCWGIVLVITGTYLSWPKKFKVRGVLVPRLKGKLYTVLRDLHAVPAVYLGAFLFCIMVTGLVFTNYWGTGLRAGILVTGGFPESFVSPPKSIVPEGIDQPARISIDQAVQIVRANGFPHQELGIAIPHHEADDAIVASVRQPTGASLRAQMHVDQYSGKVLSKSDLDNVPAATVALLYALPIHQGSIFGLPTKILAFASALMLAILVTTAVLMWWKRRPQGTLGTPRRQDVAVPRWMVGVILILSVLMPVVGVSLLGVTLMDWLWQRRSRTAIA